jgi:hypothetical protein
MKEEALARDGPQRHKKKNNNLPCGKNTGIRNAT